jgi:hypothetical protein
MKSRSVWIRQSMLKEYDGGDEGRDKLYRYHADGLSVGKTEGHRAGRVPQSSSVVATLGRASFGLPKASLSCRVSRL